MHQMLNLNKLLWNEQCSLSSTCRYICSGHRSPHARDFVSLFFWICDFCVSLFINVYSRWNHIVHAVLLFILCSPSQSYRLCILPLRSIDKKRLIRHLYHSKYMNLLSDQSSSIWYFIYPRSSDKIRNLSHLAWSRRAQEWSTSFQMKVL